MESRADKHTAGLLGTLKAASRKRAQAALARRSLEDWRTLATGRPAPRTILPDGGGFDLICEVKFASPSAGALQAGSAAEAARRAAFYETAGAAAISVLTEPERFGGALEFLEEVARSVAVPVMRKDFLVDVVQVLEARIAGASGVLLITRMLTDNALKELLETTGALGLFALVEAFDAVDLERTARVLEEVAGCAAVLVGVNSRNLVTLEVERDRLFELAPLLPTGYLSVAESGLETPRDAEELAAAGYRAALVGTALMRADDPARLASEMLAAGRRGHACKEAGSCS